jgi:hypothetical protein
MNWAVSFRSRDPNGDLASVEAGDDTSCLLTPLEATGRCVGVAQRISYAYTDLEETRRSAICRVLLDRRMAADPGARSSHVRDYKKIV